MIVTKWEYNHKQLDFIERNVQERLDELGNQGWEIIKLQPEPGCDTYDCFSRRPVQWIDNDGLLQSMKSAAWDIGSKNSDGQLY